MKVKIAINFDLKKLVRWACAKIFTWLMLRWISWLWKVHHLAEMSEKLPLQSWQLQPLLLIFVLISSCQPISTWLTFNTTAQLLAELQGFTITGCFMKAMCIGNPSLSSLSLAWCVMKWICMGSWCVARRKPFLLFICNTKRSSNIFFSYLSSIFLQRKKANFIMKENKTSLSNIVITGKECDK